MGHNYCNQLYGRPAGLPWALQINPAHRHASTAALALHQATFLYESLCDAACSCCRVVPTGATASTAVS